MLSCMTRPHGHRKREAPAGGERWRRQPGHSTMIGRSLAPEPAAAAAAARAWASIPGLAVLFVTASRETCEQKGQATCTSPSWLPSGRGTARTSAHDPQRTRTVVPVDTEEPIRAGGGSPRKRQNFLSEIYRVLGFTRGREAFVFLCSLFKTDRPSHSHTSTFNGGCGGWHGAAA